MQVDVARRGVSEWIREGRKKMGLFADKSVSAGTWITTFGPLNLRAYHGSARAHGYSFQLPTRTLCGFNTTWATPKSDWHKHYSAPNINHTCCKLHRNTTHVPTKKDKTVNCKVYKDVANKQEYLVNYTALSCKGESLRDFLTLVLSPVCVLCLYRGYSGIY